MYYNIKLYVTRNYINFSYIINFFFPTYIFLLLYIVGKENFSLNFALLLSINQFLIFSLSGHMRNWLLSNQEVQRLNITILERIIIITSILIINFFLINFFFNFNESNIYYFVFILVILFCWIKEIFIAYLQIKKINFQILFYIDCFVILIFTSTTLYDFNLFLIPIICYCGLNLIFFIFLTKKIFLNYKHDISNPLKKNLYNFDKKDLKYFYFSTTALSFSNFLIRYLISTFFDISNASTLVFCFSIGSMPATLYVNTVGINLVNRRKLIPNYFKIILCIYLFILFFSLSNIFYFDFSYFTEFFYIALFFSSSASFIFLLSQVVRLKKFVQNNLVKNVLKNDIVYALLQILIAIFIIYFQKNLLVFLIFIYSILSYIIYEFFIIKRI